MRFRIVPDVGDRGGDALLQEPNLDILFGIGIDRHRLAMRLELPDAFDQVREIGDGPVSDRAHDCLSALIESIRQQEAQPQRRTVGDVHGDVALPVRPVAHRVGEAPADFLERVEDVFAGAEGVLAEIRA